MTHHVLLYVLAVTFIVCAAMVVLIDSLVDLTKFGTRFKWSLLWYTARYLGIICATLLALNILVYKET